MLSLGVVIGFVGVVVIFSSLSMGMVLSCSSLMTAVVGIRGVARLLLVPRCRQRPYRCHICRGFCTRVALAGLDVLLAPCVSLSVRVIPPLPSLVSGVVWCGQVVVSVLFVQEVVGLVLPSRCLQRPYLCHTGSCLSWVGLLVAGLVVSLLLNFASGLLLNTFMCEVV